MRIQSLFLAVALLTPLLAAGSAAPGEPVIGADTAAKFAEQVAHVRDEMKPGGRYEFIRENDSIRLDHLLATMGALLMRHGSAAAMSRDARIELFNAQEQVNAILRHNDELRLVCESRPKIGSNIPQTTCRTFGDIERDRRAGNQTLLEHDNQRFQTMRDHGDGRGGN